jgi:hypothetical protein
MIIFDADDFGANRILSDQCQSHDCRDKLDQFHYANPNFKATLFAIPAQMTYELAEWCVANQSWIELAMHGIFHSSNFECEKMTYKEFEIAIGPMRSMLDTYFTKGFKAPGWQISDDIYKWLMDNGWWVADQAYNNDRRPRMPHYIVGENSMHHHTWDCVGNGVYELSDDIISRIKDETEFKFVSEVVTV